MLSTPESATRRGRLVALLAVVAAVAGVLVGIVAPLAAAPVAAPAAATTYGAPSWWNGDCDTVDWTSRARAAGWTGEAAHRLGGVVLGIPVCGPRNLAGAPNVWWSRPGWGELEWQCVEFAQRFMIQVYGVNPYQANGVDVVNHYTTAQGGGLVRVDNGTVGRAPQPGDVMSFSSATNPYGHVAVVASTSVDASGNGQVRLATQNDTVDGWRTLTVSNWTTQAFGSLYPYAWLHDPLGRGSDTPAPLADGDFVKVGTDPTTYRIAGGAPVYLSSWSIVGGPQPVRIIDQAQFDALPTYPRDGTFLRTAGDGRTFRVAGGAALEVGCGTGMNSCAGAVVIDPAAVTRASTGYPWDHLRQLPADGTFLRVADDAAPPPGTHGRVAGTALLPITDCAVFAGCATAVTVPAATVAAYRAAHPVPLDGTVLRLQPSGRYAAFYRGHCALTDPASPFVDVGDASAVCPPPLPIADPTTARLVAGRPGRVQLTVTGAAAPIAWSLAAGALPGGVSLSAAGVVTGTMPAGPFALTVRAVDPTGAWGLRTVTVPVAPVLSIVTTTLPVASVRQPYTATVVAQGGRGSYRFALVSGALPAGLRLSARGVVSGTPTRLETSTVEIALTDGDGMPYRVTASVNVVVGPAGGIAFPTSPAPTPTG